MVAWTKVVGGGGGEKRSDSGYILKDELMDETGA